MPFFFTLRANIITTAFHLTADLDSPKTHNIL